MKESKGSSTKDAVVVTSSTQTTLTRTTSFVESCSFTKNNKTSSSSSSVTSSSSSVVSVVLLSSIVDYILSIVWLLLCTILVYKHNDLLIVFFSFALCFITSSIISIVRKELFHTKINSISNPQTKYWIGYIIYTYTLCTMTLSLLSSSSSSINSSNNNNSSSSTSEISSSLSLTGESLQSHEMLLLSIQDFNTLSIIGGYIVYDHWYTAIYCSTTFEKSISNNSNNSNNKRIKTIWTVIEDAITLSIMLFILVVLPTTTETTTTTTTTTIGMDYGALLRQILMRSTTTAMISVSVLISLWIAYRLVRLFYMDVILTDITSISSGKVAMSTKEVNDASTIATTKPLTMNKTNTNVNVWKIYGNTYDLTEFVTKHPGGIDSIMLGCNRPDCTPLIQSYHPFTITHVQSILKKYRIKNSDNNNDNDDDVVTKECKQVMKIYEINKEGNDNDFVGHYNDVFYQEMCNRVQKGLLDVGIDPIKSRTATTTRIVYYCIVFIGLVYSFIWHIHGSVIGSFTLAIFGWLIGSLGHDSGHYSASHNSIINKIGVWGMCLLCNPIMWQHQHTYAHHSYTNIFNKDPDLHHFDKFIKVHESFIYTTTYKNQSNKLYVFITYSLVCFGTCFWIPISMIIDKSLYGIVDWTDYNTIYAKFGMYCHLLCYIVIIMILPYFVQPNIVYGFISVFVHVTTSGLLFAIFSQINHINELSFPNVNKNNNNTTATSTTTSTIGSTTTSTPTTMNKNNTEEQQSYSKLHNYIKDNCNSTNSWAIEQIISSNNFCPQSIVWHILSNGLNLQIEHHLFPSINHCHLSIIQPIVEQVCIEYNVPYKSYNSWIDIMNATLQWLQQLSTNDDDNNNNNNHNVIANDDNATVDNDSQKTTTTN